MSKALLITIILLTQIFCFAQKKQPGKISPMNNIDQIYPVFITKKLQETAKFYEQYFGFTKLFESTFFVLLQTSGEKKFCVAFMDEEHPTTPPNPAKFNANGAFLTLEVPDAGALFEDVQKRKLPITYALKDEPWGQRRFGVIDPNGLWVDVVQQIEPQAGFWDKYVKP